MEAAIRTVQVGPSGQRADTGPPQQPQSISYQPRIPSGVSPIHRPVDTPQSYSSKGGGPQSTPTARSVASPLSPPRPGPGVATTYPPYSGGVPPAREAPLRYVQQSPYSTVPFRENPYARIPQVSQQTITDYHRGPIVPVPNSLSVSIGPPPPPPQPQSLPAQQSPLPTNTMVDVVATTNRPRISLLPHTAPVAEYIPPVRQPPQNVPLSQDPGGPPAFKKIRLGEQQQPHQHHHHHHHHHHPHHQHQQQHHHHHQSVVAATVVTPPPLLKVDVREPPQTQLTGAYHPQVEAISPTLPNDPSEEFRATKDELLQHITTVDIEINKAEKTIEMLKKKEASLEETTAKPTKSEENQEVQPKHRSLAQKIYAENRKKAIEAHETLGSLGPPVDMPLYNQPSDVEICKEIIQRHQSFKSRFLLHLRKIKAERAARNTALAEKYAQLSQEWLRRVDKAESSAKRKAKEAKNREFFEKVFTELRKQREDKERFNRVGSRIKSEADLEEIMDGLQEQAMEDKKMRSYAVIPPLMLDARQRRCMFYNENGALADMEADFKERKNQNVWTAGEKEIFKEKFLQHPKNFGAIAASLDRKSAEDCVRYYYLSKKTENYKQLLRKSRQRTRSSRNPQKSNQNPSQCIVDALTTGVTTRLQREQQQKTGGRDRAANSTITTATTMGTVTTTTTATLAVTSTSTASPITGGNNNSNSIISNPLILQPTTDVVTTSSGEIMVPSLSTVCLPLNSSSSMSGMTTVTTTLTTTTAEAVASLAVVSTPTLTIATNTSNVTLSTPVSHLNSLIVDTTTETVKNTLLDITPLTSAAATTTTTLYLHTTAVSTPLTSSSFLTNTSASTITINKLENSGENDQLLEANDTTHQYHHSHNIGGSKLTNMTPMMSAISTASSAIPVTATFANSSNSSGSSSNSSSSSNNNTIISSTTTTSIITSIATTMANTIAKTAAITLAETTVLSPATVSISHAGTIATSSSNTTFVNVTITNTPNGVKTEIVTTLAKSVANNSGTSDGSVSNIGKIINSDCKTTAPSVKNASVNEDKAAVSTVATDGIMPSIPNKAKQVIIMEQMDENEINNDLTKKRLKHPSESTEDDAALECKDKLYPCFVCKDEMCSRTRPLEKGRSHQYGIPEDGIPPGARVCNSCQCKSVRNRYQGCPLPTCPNLKDRVKRFRNLPPRLFELAPDVRDPLIQEFQIPPNVTKCCSACLIKIKRKLGSHLLGAHLTDDEVCKFKILLQEIGPKWPQLGESLSKTPMALKSFYFHYKKKHSFDVPVAEYYKLHPGEERRTAITDGDESDVSTTSGDDRETGSDTASAESPNNPSNQTITLKDTNQLPDSQPSSTSSSSLSTVVIPVLSSQQSTGKPSPASIMFEDDRLLPPLAPQAPRKQHKTAGEEYDSSATETADEENESSPANRQSPKVLLYPNQTTITMVPTSLQNGPRETLASELNMRDVMLNVIERTLKTGQQQPPPPKPSPASLIKQTLQESRTDIKFVREYRSTDVTKSTAPQFPSNHKPQHQQQTMQLSTQTPIPHQRPSQTDGLATLSVVNSHGHGTIEPISNQQHSHLISSQIAATITPVHSQSLSQQNQHPTHSTGGIVSISTQADVKDNLVIYPREPEPQTLDLSIKKPQQRENCPPSLLAKQQSMSGTVSMYRNDPSHPSGIGAVVTIANQTQNIPVQNSPTTYLSYHHHPDMGRPSKSPSAYVATVPGTTLSITQQQQQLSNTTGQLNMQNIRSNLQQQQQPQPLQPQQQQQSLVVQQPQQPKAKPTPKLSPKMQQHHQSGGNQQISGSKGSITHGTPVNSTVAGGQSSILIQGPTTLSPRFDGILRQTPPSGCDKLGSITQGTPVHLPSHHLPDKQRVFDYYKNNRQSPAQPPPPPPPHQVSAQQAPSPSSSAQQPSPQPLPTFGSPYARTSAFSLEQQQPLSSRQIIMNDYITSQQMHGQQVRCSSRTDKESPSPRSGAGPSALYYSEKEQRSRSEYLNRTSPPIHVNSTPSPHRTPPPQRQGVIQRHNTISSKPPSPASNRIHIIPQHHYPPPGHEAFSSLVDVAVQQPLLPVPHKDEKRSSGSVAAEHTTSHHDIRLHQQMAREQSLAMQIHQQQQLRQQQQQQHQQQNQHQLDIQRRQHQQQQSAATIYREQIMERDRRENEYRERERERERIQLQERERGMQHHVAAAAAAADRERAHHVQVERERAERHHHQQQQQQQQQQHQHHHQQHHHQQQQQQQERLAAVERDRNIQASMERDRSIQASIERDRSLQIERERITQQTNQNLEKMIEEQEREERRRDATRLLVNINSPGFLRDQQSAVVTSASRGSLPERERESRTPSGRSMADGTLTAANLIDAIITHQINQTATDPPAGSLGRDSHRQTFFSAREIHPSIQTENNGKAHSPNVINIDLDPDRNRSQVLTKNITLGELTDSIIAKDYSPNPFFPLRQPFMQYHHQDAFVTTDQWKYNRRMQHKEEQQTQQSPQQIQNKSIGCRTLTMTDERQIIRKAHPSSPRGKATPSSSTTLSSSSSSSSSFHEPVSPPDGHFYHPPVSIQNSNRVVAPTPSLLQSQQPPSQQQPALSAHQSHQFALDCYVKNRIVEAMRTDEKRSEDSSPITISTSSNAERRTPKHHHASSSKDSGADSNVISGGSTDIIIDEGNNSIGGSMTPSMSVTASILPSQSNPDQLHTITNNSTNSGPIGGNSTQYNQSPVTTFATSATYAYPFNALNVSVTSGVQLPLPPSMAIDDSAIKRLQQPTPVVVTAQEPKPLLSAQFDALSDED